MSVVAGLAERSESMPGVRVGYSAGDEGASGFGVVVGHCGRLPALHAESMFARVGGAVPLPVAAVAAFGGGASGLVGLAALVASTGRARSGGDGASAARADAAGLARHGVAGQAPDTGRGRRCARSASASACQSLQRRPFWRRVKRAMWFAGRPTGAGPRTASRPGSAWERHPAS